MEEHTATGTSSPRIPITVQRGRTVGEYVPRESQAAESANLDSTATATAAASTGAVRRSSTRPSREPGEEIAVSIASFGVAGRSTGSTVASSCTRESGLATARATAAVALQRTRASQHPHIARSGEVDPPTDVEFSPGEDGKGPRPANHHVTVDGQRLERGRRQRLPAPRLRDR